MKYQSVCRIRLQRLFASLSVLLFVLVAQVHPKDWNGIVPQKSTRADVERSLGKSGSISPLYGLYQDSDHQVTIEYLRTESGADLMDDLVLSIWVYPMKRIYLTDAQPDLSGFRKASGRKDELGLAFYSNAKEGFTIQVQKPLNAKKETVTAFIYYKPLKAKE